MSDQQRAGIYNSGIFRLWAPAGVLEQRTQLTQKPQPPPVPAETTLWIDATVELSIFDPDFSIFDPKQSIDPRAFLRSIGPKALRYLPRPSLKQSRLWAAVSGFVVTAVACGLVLLVASSTAATDGASDKQQRTKLTVSVPETAPPQATQAQDKKVALAVVPDRQAPVIDPQPPPVRTRTKATKTKAKTRKRRARSQRHPRRSRRTSVDVDVDALLRPRRRASASRSTVDVDAILLAGTR